MDDAHMTVVATTPLTAERPEWPRVRGRWIRRPDRDGWSDFVLSEWELERAGFADLHSHTETNVVLAGELFVECAGRTVTVVEGAAVTVPAGHRGRYWAPHYARMLAIYGASNSGAPPTELDYWEL